VVIRRHEHPSLRFVRDVSFRTLYWDMLVSAYTIFACLLPAALAFSPSFPYGTEKVRGVSLGGWFVTEVSIPSPFLFLSSHCVRYMY